MTTLLGAHFASVDASTAPDAFVAYLEHAEALPPMVRVRERVRELLAAASGEGADIGSGTGRALAELYAGGLAGTGVDRSAAMVRAAQNRHPELTFVSGDAECLPFPSASLSWYRAERVYLHLDDPQAALGEAYRVLAPGARIVLADPDFDSVVVTSGDPALSRELSAAFTDSLPNGRAGTRNPAHLARAGFTGIRIDALPLAFTSLDMVEPLWILPALAQAGALAAPEQVADWYADLRDRAARDEFLGAVTMFITSAQRPT